MNVPVDDPTDRATALDQILERVSDGFVAVDRDWRYTYVNRSAARILRRNAEDLIGAHVWTEFPEAVGSTMHRAQEEALATQRPAFLEAYYAPWDSWFENRIYPSATGLSIFFSEITERKRAEAVIERETQGRGVRRRSRAGRRVERARRHARTGTNARRSLVDRFVARSGGQDRSRLATRAAGSERRPRRGLRGELAA